MCKSQVVLLALVLVACSKGPPADGDTVTLTIDAGRITVSGISSGAYMAGQLHVAHSGLFSGAALIAGGPYYCAEGSVTRGIGPCIQGGDLGTTRLTDYAREMSASGNIDAVNNLVGDPVWLFIGTLDDKVNADVAQSAADFYRRLQADVTLVDDIAVVHGMPTLAVGLACDAFGSPFIQNCGYDAAGTLLRALYGELAPRTRDSGELRSIAQVGGADADMLGNAYLYVPAICAAGESCGVHVAFHGCAQSSDFVGDAFATGAGYNEWAEANRLLVLYPQVGSSKIAPMNPLGCWDWWGYTDENYATRSGPQIKVVKAMLDSLAGATL
jgi:poly(3-hydroxybutyrate) depolymerase